MKDSLLDIEKNIQPEEVIFYDEPIRLKANFEIRGMVIKEPTYLKK